MLIEEEQTTVSERTIYLQFAGRGWRICAGSIRDATLEDVPSDLLVKHFLVKGRVQGVGFRWFVHREAAEIGLRGWVKNTDEGHVEIVAAGDAGRIEELKSALHQGSRGSRVDAVIEHTLAESEAERLKEFEIEGAW